MKGEPKHTRYMDVRQRLDGTLDGYETRDGQTVVRFSADPALFLIQRAWHRGCSFEREADGFGRGGGTNGDWSAIRDSTEAARDVMLTKALNYLFGEE